VSTEQLCEYATSLSVTDARAIAEKILRDPDLIKLNQISSQLPDQITGTTREAFKEFGSIISFETCFEFGPSAFGDSNYYPGAFRIGFDMDYTEYVLAPDHSGLIWIDELGYEHTNGMMVEYPSIYNRIVESHLSANRSKLSHADLFGGSGNKIADW
jgi:hypothetical protein